AFDCDQNRPRAPLKPLTAIKTAPTVGGKEKVDNFSFPTVGETKKSTTFPSRQSARPKSRQLFLPDERRGQKVDNFSFPTVGEAQKSTTTLYNIILTLKTRNIMQVEIIYLTKLQREELFGLGKNMVVVNSLEIKRVCDIAATHLI
ncbi:MAG: hypothetical protein MJZ96_08405, partial [Paludibacteraceae bacterium]|nr:hypothetical protein [Paludibacteraceae bacterium]